MRICVVGAGIAGALLAWRLGDRATVDLITGPPGADATASSGGGVRGFETHPLQRRLAIESLSELLGTLHNQAVYTETGCTYLLPAYDGIESAVAEVEDALPGSATLVDSRELHRRGWHDLPAGTVGVLERRAGFINPDRLRTSVVRRLAFGRTTRVLTGPVLRLLTEADGTVSCRLPDRTERYDAVVVAAGSWTPGFLTENNFGVNTRTKAVQIAVYRVDGQLPTMFVDETSDLYGRPTADGRLLLGVDTQRWSVPPGSSAPVPDLAEQAVRIAGRRLPQLKLSTPDHLVSTADCYADPPVLTLWPVPGGTHRLYTFTGGSGGSVKTALAASRAAASELLAAGGTSTSTSRTENKRMTITEPGIRRADTQPVSRYHTIGIGAGPSNLSLAALYKNVTSERLALFDSRPGTGWHTPLLYPGVRMQTGWMKDLVSLVDPRHELTFLNYLVTSGRLYALINSQFDSLPRIEYERYLTWATERLGVVNFGAQVDAISLTDEGFQITVDGVPAAVSEHLVLGVGTRAVRPAYLGGLPAERAFIADDLGQRLAALDRTAPTAVIGGGQTGLESVLRLLGSGFTDVRWLGRNQWFRSIDDSPMANELYRPSHIQYLQGLNRGKRRQMIDDSRYSGDAITPGGLRALYQANYDGFLSLGQFPVTLLPGRDVQTSDLLPDGNIRLCCSTSTLPEEHVVRQLVVAAGREHVAAPFDDDLRERVEVDDDGDLLVEPDYSVRWKGMNGHKIYTFNASRYSHGLTNAGLTQLPVRAAIVLNSMFEREIYPIADDVCAVRW
ncbi:FAD-dependent oxidoreductase [Kribbella sandramycini]|uniref:L-lysine N6-monooxygenase MbtG n=2 Tax=Kribbella sandramycini TaxID=60450 RepID=A0A841SF22_9ACTN|nr:FAD-dependent oxidoreductase [Kribbella sandramycini]MBB6568621.1 lysine/ornithine N-monooxygenase/glycine/D-amino acid oxidase-like deaminating enzyme [Kribbella sandramycini]